MTSEDEKLVSKFVALLGNKKVDAGPLSTLSSKSASSTQSRMLLACLSKKVPSHEVVCTVPSLDMRKIEDETGGESVLPKVGEHHVKMDTSSDGAGEGPGTSMSPSLDARSASSSGDDKIPKMEASFLKTAENASARAAQVEQKAAQNLGALTSWTKSSVMYASDAIANNVSESFSYLIDSRVQTWTVLLLRHSVTSGDSTSRSSLLRMLFSTIKVDSTTTTFRALPLPDAARLAQKDADVILPLLLQVNLQVSIHGKMETVTLRAPGTISASTEVDSTGVALKKADIRLDTGKLLASMVQQARLVVYKAVEKATAATESSNADMTDSSSKDTSGGLAGKKPPPTLSSGFRSALSLSASNNVPSGPHQPNHRLGKARPSALRLNTALQKTGGGVMISGDVLDVGASANAKLDPALEKIRKTRSIQWENGIVPKIKSPALPTAKRQRVAQTSARLASFKSFGRPHAGDFGSGPRNATFGDFGSSGPIWGRNGRLANHPRPMQSKEHQDNDWTNTGAAVNKKNATFDDLVKSKPRIHLMHVGHSASSSSGGMTRSNSSGGRNESGGGGGVGMNRISSTLPRTATALEGFALKSLLSHSKGL